MKMHELRLIVADRLCKLEDELNRAGLKINRMTLVARDYENDEMGICVTNEPPEKIKQAFDLALEKWT